MKLPEALNNSYLAMRHGESEANRAGTIVSDPAVGTRAYGLSTLGRSQAKSSAEALGGPAPTLVLSSDFMRARETAEIAAHTFAVDEIVLCEELRERFFGAFDGRSADNYERVWLRDAEDADQTAEMVETVHAVRKRLATLIMRLEAHHRNERILLVSHGDPLQILQTLFENAPAKAHRSMPHLHVAEIRPLARRSGERTPT